MDIQTIAIDQINPAAYNPRKDLKPEDAEYQKLKKSITEFDMVEPLVWNKRSGNLVGGHQRLKILKSMDIKSVEVSVVDLDDTKEKALNLALNKISGEWDNPLLKDLLLELDTGEFDIEITGFDLDEIAELMNQLFVPESGNTDDDAVPEATESICKKGDLWQLGNHRLLCGDATVLTDVEKLMAGEKADMVFTDPPYGVDYEGGSNNQKKREKLIGDDCDLYSGFIPLLPVKNKAAMYVWFAGREGKVVYTALSDWRIRAMIVWVKLNPHYGAFTAQYMQRHEPLLYCVKGKPTWNGPSNDTTIWEYPQPSKNELHPTQKPIALCEHGISNSSNIKDIVLDLFGGSGSTLIACQKLNRACRMMEIDEHYCDVIIKRWEEFTGKEAVRLDAGT